MNNSERFKEILEEWTRLCKERRQREEKMADQMSKKKKKGRNSEKNVNIHISIVPLKCFDGSKWSFVKGEWDCADIKREKAIKVKLKGQQWCENN